MSTQERESLLKHFIRKEILKKVTEINKNYNDLSRFKTDEFNEVLINRLMKKLETGESKEK